MPFLMYQLSHSDIVQTRLSGALSHPARLIAKLSILGGGGGGGGGGRRSAVVLDDKGTGMSD